MIAALKELVVAFAFVVFCGTGGMLLYLALILPIPQRWGGNWMWIATGLVLLALGVLTAYKATRAKKTTD